MRILLASSGSGSRGGGEIFLDYLGQGLAERGHEILLWIPSHPRMDELAERCARFSRVIRADYHNTYDYPLRSIPTRLNWHVSRRISRQWDELKPDIIHLNKQNLEDGLDLLRAADRCAAPSVSTIHLTQTAEYLRAKWPRLRDWISYDALSRYRGILVAVQEARRAELSVFLSHRVRTRTIYLGVQRTPLRANTPKTPDISTQAAERTQTIFYGVPSPSVSGNEPIAIRYAKRQELGFGDDTLLVIGLGRLVQQKRPFLFLERARQIHALLPSARFLWVGDGPLRAQWEQAIADAGLQGVISCGGWQTDATPYLLAGDLMLHVAEYEGLPLAILEAMNVGLPCAITQELASEIPFFDDQTVLPADDPPTLVKRLHSPDDLASVSANARQLVETKLSLQAMSEAYETLYLSALQK